MKTSLILSLVLLSTLTGAVHAQEPQPMLPPIVVVEIDGKPQPIELTRVSAEVRILGPIAETRMTMTFFNPHDRAHEGDLYFPLPEGATISGYALDIHGSMVDGVAVTKQKARQTFEKEVRKGIDPGIVEWTRGNSFKTRIFPLPAKGARTITVSYVAEVLDTPAGSLYQLPLNFREKVGEFSLRVEVVKSLTVPKLSEHELVNFAFEKWNEGFLAETNMKDAVLAKPFSVTLPRTDEIPVLIERDGKGVVRFLVTANVPAPPAERAPAPQRLAILWDASGSRGGSDHLREIAFLKRYLEAALEMRPSIDATVTIFRDRAAAPVNLTLTPGKLNELEGLLAGIPYDGGTSLASATAPEADLVLLFTDGLSTFGESEPGKTAAPIYVINSATVADAAFMRSLARRTGGQYLNLKRTTVEKAVEAIGRPVHSFLSASVAGGRIEESYPAMPEPVDGRFLLAGVLKGDEAEVVLNFGVHGVTSTKTIAISAAEAVEGDLLRRFWAQKKLAHLLTDQKRNEAAIVRLGRKQGLVTPFTSLIVLESLEQYLEHEILPPVTLTEMREKYLEIVESRRREFETIERSKLERIVARWEQRVKWWETKFTYPAGFKYRNPEEEKSEGGLGGRAEPRPNASPMAPGDSAPAPVEGEAPSGRESGGDGGGFGFSDGETADKDGGPGGPAGGPAIALSEWDPKTPYLAALKAAAPAKQFEVYLAMREKYHTSPAFFLDCADFFFKQKNEPLAVQVLSNIAEMELESAPLLRILGHRLAQLGYLDLSVLVFTQAKKIRPEEPQSYRDLGLVLAKRGTKADLERAIDLLYRVVLDKWERFDEIELLTLMELNQVIPKAKAAGVKDIPVDPRLVKPLDLDVRIVMTWDADLTDMDLHVLEPSDEEAYYGHNRTTIGGLVSKDFTQGYGPEEYLVKRAMPGRYIIKTNFYGSSAAKLIGAVTLQVDVYTNYGRPNQKVQSMTLRLTGAKDMFIVGEIEF